MKKQILILCLFVFSILSYSQIYRSEILDISTNESLIIGKTSRLNFNMLISIEGKKITKEDFCYLFKEKGNNFVKISNLEIKNNRYKKRGNNIYFSEHNERLNEKIELLVSGVFIFNWSQNRSLYNIENTTEELAIGYISSEQNPVLLSLNLADLDPINNVKVEVIEDMDLGTAFSGEKLSTKNINNNGSPAKIRVEGKNTRKVKISIPENMEIMNNKNENLNVRLSFRENNKNILEKKLDINNGKLKDNQTIILDDILIDGECQSTKKSTGLYEGNFVVRVEYCLEN